MLCLFLVLCLVLIGCSDVNNLDKESSKENKVIKSQGLNYMTEKEDIFKKAYLDSISEYLDEEGTTSKVYIINYLGKYGEVEFAEMDSEYQINPYKIYQEYIERMYFRYSNARAKIFGVYNDKLYTIKQAYEAKLISIDDVCELFLINSNSVSGLTIAEMKEFEDIIIAEDSLNDSFIYTRYYGKYNGYSAITIDNHKVMRIAVCKEEYIANLRFTYPYPGTHIRLIKKNKMYTITEAHNKKIIDLQDVYELFQIHTGSENINTELINTLLTPGYKIHKEYIKDFSMKKLFLQNYYGEYNNCHIFSFYSTEWLAKYLQDTTDKLLQTFKYGCGSYEYLLCEGELYLLNDAIEEGIINEEAINELL